MANTPKKPVKDTKSLRQVASDKAEKATSKKRRLKVPTKNTNKQPGKIKKAARFVVPKYFRNSWKELRQVAWPDRRQTWRLTWAVIAFAVVFGIVIAIVDFGLDKLFKELLLK